MEKQCQNDVITELNGPISLKYYLKMCCHGNINRTILVKFGTKIQRSISNKLQIFVKIYWEMTSQWRHYCFGGLDLSEAPPRKCCHGNSKRSTLKLVLKNSYIFSGKVISLVELSFFFSELWAKNLKGGALPPGRIGLTLLVTGDFYLSCFPGENNVIQLVWFPMGD